MSVIGPETCSETHANGEKGDGLVDPPQWRDINGLTADRSLRADTGRVFPGTSVDDGVDWKRG